MSPVKVTFLCQSLTARCTLVKTVANVNVLFPLSLSGEECGVESACHFNLMLLTQNVGNET